jgi:O-antigen/teichoic acid export membrane protein
MTMKAQAYTAVRWTTFVTAARVALQTIQLIVLARLISPQDFGLMAMIVTVTAFIQMFSDLGINQSILQDQNISQKTLSALYWLNLAVGVLMTVIVAASAPALASFYSEPALAAPLAACSLSFVLLALGQQVKVLTEKRLDFKSVAMIELASAIISTVATLVSAYMGAGVYALVLGVLLLTGGNSILYLLFARNGWRPGFDFDLKEAGRHARVGLYLLGTSLANTATVQLDVIIVGRMLGSAALGAYSVPRELCLKAMYATNPIITRVGMPIISRAQGDKDLLRRVYLQTIRMTSSVNFPIYMAIALFRHETTYLLFGEKWAASADLLGMLAIWGMFRSLGAPIGILLYGTGNSKLALKQSIGVMVAIIPMCFLGAVWGTMGVAIALTLFYFIFINVLWAIVVKPLTGATFLQYSDQWVRPLLTAVLACGIASTVWLLDLPQIPHLIGGLVLGGIAYLALSWFTNRAWCDAIFHLTGLDRMASSYLQTLFRSNRS